MKRRVMEVEVMGAGRYRVVVQTKRWWQRRWRLTTFTGRGTVWTQVEPWGGRCSTSMEWWLTNVALRFRREAEEAKHAAR